VEERGVGCRIILNGSSESGMAWHGLDSSGSEQEKLRVFCECGNELGVL